MVGRCGAEKGRDDPFLKRAPVYSGFLDGFDQFVDQGVGVVGMTDCLDDVSDFGLE